MKCFAWPGQKHGYAKFIHSEMEVLLENEYPLRRELNLELRRAGLWGRGPHLIGTESGGLLGWPPPFNNRARGSRLAFRRPRSVLRDARMGSVARAGSPVPSPVSSSVK